MIREGCKVAFHYDLSVEGQGVDSTREREPVEYVHGTGAVPPGLERALDGMAEGEEKTVVLPPEEGFGPHDPEGVIPLPLAVFAGQADVLQVGQIVEGEINDTPFTARVEEIGPEEITLDFNHPLAGRTVEYRVEIVAVQSPGS